MDTARKTVLILLCLLLIPAGAFALPEPSVTQPGKAVQWIELEKGMEKARLVHTVQRGDYPRRVLVHALRLNSAFFTFALYGAGWEDGRPRTMNEWLDEHDLAAAINACMYQIDGLTSTGYMRSGERLNNKRIVKKYGAFFVSGPRAEGLPQAAVLDRTADDWAALLPHYENVVQNFRLMGRQGEQLWPENGPRHAIAAVAEDLEGRILFLICSEALSVHDFVDALNAHPGLKLKTAMYVEGGSDAAFVIRTRSKTRFFSGQSPAGYVLSMSGDDIPLPNIIGVKRR